MAGRGGAKSGVVASEELGVVCACAETPNATRTASSIGVSCAADVTAAGLMRGPITVCKEPTLLVGPLVCRVAVNATVLVPKGGAAGGLIMLTTD